VPIVARGALQAHVLRRCAAAYQSESRGEVLDLLVDEAAQL